MCRNPLEKEFLKSYDGLLRADLTWTNKRGLNGRPAGASSLVGQKAIVRFQKFFFQWISTH